MYKKCHGSRSTRRTVLGAGATLGVAALAGCTNLGGSAPPAAMSLTDGQACDVCGMVIEKHPGPDGQIFYQKNAPEGHDNPARFDSLKQCLFPYLLEHEQLGWRTAAVYVTDYSSVEYTVTDEGGSPVISSHPEAKAFAPAADLSYVVDSDVEGAMGPDFLPFSNAEDAEAFAAEYGGDVLGFDEIDEGVIGK